jgi:hypothetical protein
VPFLTFMVYACVCVAVAVGVAAPYLVRPGRRGTGFLLLTVSSAALVGALWLVARPIPSFTGHGAPRGEDAAAPAPQPLAPPAPPTTISPRPATGPGDAAHAPNAHTAPPVSPKAPGSPADHSLPTPPSTPPVEPPPTTQPPATPPPATPPPTGGPSPVRDLVHGVAHQVRGVLGSVGHLI